MLINGEPDLHVCCEAAEVKEAVEANRSCAHDLVIVDLSLAGMSGLELIRRFRFEFPNTLILVMSMHSETIYAEQALRAGAHGYLMKQVATDTLLHAIRIILKGELYVGDQIRSRMLKQTMHGNVKNSPVSGLTLGEFEIIHLIGLGLGTSEISQKLNRSAKTVESHKASIKKKLMLKSGNELTHFAINLVSKDINT